MFQRFYKKNRDEELSTFILPIVFIIILVIGAVLLFTPALGAVKKLWKNKPLKLELIVILPEKCDNCFDIYQATNFIKDGLNVQYKSENELKGDSVEAQELIAKYDIKVLPTFMLTGKLSSLGLDSIFSEEAIGKLDNDLFVYNNPFPPYVDLASGEVRGGFNVTFLTDNACDECYDIELHRNAFENLIMNPSLSVYNDVSSAEGKSLVAKYKIKYAPTIILTGDLAVYKSFDQLWQGVGSIESDGAYVFRENGLNLMGAYQNLRTGELINKLDKLNELDLTQ